MDPELKIKRKARRDLDRIQQSQLLLAESANWQLFIKRFCETPEYKRMKEALLRYGIKEPYASNILHRCYVDAYNITSEIKNTRGI